MKTKNQAMTVGLTFAALMLTATSVQAFYAPPHPGNTDPSIGNIRFYPEQYPSVNGNGFSYPALNANGTDIFNGRTNGSRTYVFDSFSTAVTVGSAQPHFFGSWLNNAPGSITALHIQLYSDNNGDLGTLLFSGTYVNNATFVNGPNYSGPAPGPTTDPAYNRNRDFGIRNELFGQRYWFDGTSLSGPSANNMLQIATPTWRANGYTCCGPLSDNSNYWIGFSVDTTGGSFGAATNFVPAGQQAAPFSQGFATAASMSSDMPAVQRFARTVVISDAAVSALEQAQSTIADPNVTPEQKAAAQNVVAPSFNVVALLANTSGGTPPTLTPEQIASFGLTQDQFNSLVGVSGEIIINGQNVNLLLAPVPLPPTLLLLVSGFATLLGSRRVRTALMA